MVHDPNYKLRCSNCKKGMANASFNYRNELVCPACVEEEKEMDNETT